jgi:hypothetical protein
LKKFKEVDDKILDELKDGDESSVITPVAAFVIFTSQEVRDRCLHYFNHYDDEGKKNLNRLESFKSLG